MADLNKVFLIGRLTHDPELRYTPNGAAVADLRMATSRQYTGKDGQVQKDTLYIDVTVWNRQAENCCQFLKKGRQVHVEGYLKMDTWEDKTSGQQRTKIKVEADRVQFLDRKDDAGGQSGGGGGDDEGYAPPRRPSATNEPRSSSNANANGPSRPGFDTTPGPARRPPMPAPQDDPEGDDDIPF